MTNISGKTMTQATMDGRMCNSLSILKDMIHPLLNKLEELACGTNAPVCQQGMQQTIGMLESYVAWLSREYEDTQGALSGRLKCVTRIMERLAGIAAIFKMYLTTPTR